jgi:hypothetical protein
MNPLSSSASTVPDPAPSLHLTRRTGALSDNLAPTRRSLHAPIPVTCSLMRLAQFTFGLCRTPFSVHAHWQVVPIKSELLEKVDAAFDSMAKEMMKREFQDEAEDDEGDAFTYWVSGRELRGDR